jgi:hypothetical protein
VSCVSEHIPRSTERIVDEQVRRWLLARREPHGAQPGPVVTVSRQHGAGGAEVARRVAADLGFQLFDREILEWIAHSAHVSPRAVTAHDERDRDVLTEWLLAFAAERYVSPLAYHEHLMRVVRTPDATPAPTRLKFVAEGMRRTD